MEFGIQPRSRGSQRIRFWITTHRATVATSRKSFVPAATVHSVEMPMRTHKHLLQVVSIFLHEAASVKRRREENDRGPGEALRQRETECIIWTARGKTAGNISDTLTISEHTLRFHINNTIRKLNDFSKTYAAAKSMQLGLIFL